MFYRGNDVYDPHNVGFASEFPEQGGRRFWRYDTTQLGNSNAGHEGKEFGTYLSPQDKDALVEFMKTF